MSWAELIPFLDNNTVDIVDNTTIYAAFGSIKTTTEEERQATKGNNSTHCLRFVNYLYYLPLA